MSVSIDEDLVDALTILGLSRKEALVLAYLLIRGRATAGDILGDLPIHQPQLYNILTSLKRKGLVYEQASRPKVYVPANPGLIMETVEEETTKRRQALIKALTQPPRQSGNLRNLIWVTRGLDNLINNAASIISEAKNELFISAPPTILARLLRNIAKLNELVKIHAIIYPEVDNAMLSVLKSIKNILEVKVDKVNNLLIAQDAETSIFTISKVSLSTNPDEVYGYVFRDRAMTLHLIDEMFNRWIGAKTVFRRGLSEVKYPMMFRSHRLAVWELMKLRELGKEVKVRVKGYYVKNNEPIEIEGVFTGKVVISPNIVNFELLTNNGKTILIGGDHAIMEDVSAELIEISLK